MQIVSSTVGWSTRTGWKRRSSAASFSMCLRYSSRVVAPMRVELAAGEHRLEQVGGVHRALGRARPDDRVELVDEEDDLALGVLDLLQDGLEALLELAAELGAGDERAEVERDDALVLQPSGTSPRTMRWASPSTIAVLPTPGSPIRTGLFFVRRLRTWMVRRISSSRPMTGSSLPARASAVRSRPYFSSASYVSSGFVAADDRIEPARPGLRGQVPAVLLEGGVGALRVRRGDALAAADALERAEDRLAAGAVALEQLAALAADLEDAEQEVLGRDVLVAETAGLALRQLEDALRPRVEGERAALDPGPPAEDRGELAAERGQVHAQPAERLGGDAVIGLDERREEVLGVEDGGI